MLFVDLNEKFFMQRKLKIFVKKFDNFRFYVRPLCELQLFAALDTYDIRHHTRAWNSAQTHPFIFFDLIGPMSPTGRGVTSSLHRSAVEEFS